ncbi:hemophore-related protein [[Mycobacterium] vasticus]|uniref:Hemophore-related protein n=1 Tax=[Mycobacterium] vasticus TaxID=2875777 RepID=A0ABU5YXW7_9MYCO|nr:hemophore-related protein [Mycolicibacter sp. MYC017]MEB3069967.1 hemophore-related protein [Mycolicibacter sp. MYC017]
MTASLTRLAAVGGMALALAAGTGLASAEPAQPGQPTQPGQPAQPSQWSQNPAINTTCSYSQVVAAMNAQSPETAANFNATPVAQSFLQDFLASPAQQREQMLEQAQGVPEAAQYVTLFGPIAKTCGKY